MKNKLKVMSVLCTRPSAIKMAPIVHAIQTRQDIENIVCVTGQHREMLDQVLRLFNITPQHDLNIMSTNQDLTTITIRVLEGMKKVLHATRPDLVLVQGDTSSTLTAALAAFYQEIPVGHVEAGLRTHNITLPFPEEANRTMTARIARYHFAPTKIARQNLLNENVDSNTVFMTGNTVIDALLWVRDKVNRQKNWSSTLGKGIQQLIDEKKDIILITGHRRENFNAGFERICHAFRVLSVRHPDWHFIYPLHLNPNVQKPAHALLSNLPNFHLIKSLDYESFIYLMDKAKIIITDSGGIQEEAPSLGKPVLVMRDVTERPEGVDGGGVLLVGTDPDYIISETESLMCDEIRYATMARIVNPYGDGKSAARIVDIISQSLIPRTQLSAWKHNMRTVSNNNRIYEYV